MHSLSVKDIKTILEIKHTHNDEYIEKMLPITIALVEKHCKTEITRRSADGSLFKDREGYIIKDIGLSLPIAKIIEFYMQTVGVSSESVSRVTYNYSTELPKSILDALKPYVNDGKIKFL